MVISGRYFHCSAIEVQPADDGVGLVAVDYYNRQEDVEAIYTLNGDAPAPITHNGRQYLVAIYPHAE